MSAWDDSAKPIMMFLVNSQRTEQARTHKRETDIDEAGEPNYNVLE